MASLVAVCGLLSGAAAAAAGSAAAQGGDGGGAEQSVAMRCFEHHRFGAEPVDVAKAADGQTVLAQVRWGYHDSIGCYLTLDDTALAVLRAAPAPQSLPDAETEASKRCFGHHQFGQRPVDVAKSADRQRVLARLSWGYHDAIGCYLVLDNTALATVRANAAPAEPEPEALVLRVNAVAGDGAVNIAEKAEGFAVSGDTGPVAGVSVSVQVGTATLGPVLSADGNGDGTATWSVSVPAAAAYVSGTSLTVTVSGSKAGAMAPSDVVRSVAVDLVAPTAPSYSVPASLQVGEQIAPVHPSGASGVPRYSAQGLPAGIEIDAATGVITGIPTAAHNIATATVTVHDSAGNTAQTHLTFPAAKPILLRVNAVAEDGTVNIAEKAEGFAVSGDTGPVAGVSVSVQVGTATLGPVLSADGNGDGTATWSVSVPAAAAYVSGTSLTVTVSGSKAGAMASDLIHEAFVDLIAPTAPSYAVPALLTVGEQLVPIDPSGASGVAHYSAQGLPAGIEIDAANGVISGTPNAESRATTATVTVRDSAGNTALTDLAFPAVLTRKLAPTVISAGDDHSCGIRADGTATCWGRNEDGQADAPTGHFTAIAAGRWHSCAVRTNRSIACWGANQNLNNSGQTKPPTGHYTVIAAGDSHSCAINTDSVIACWGHNYYGESDAPAGRFTAISAAGFLSCGIEMDGSITCWGRNSHGEADAPAGAFTAIAVGVTHSCGLRPGGTPTCWGSNFYGESDAPSGRFTAIAVGDLHSCGLRPDGAIACWGSNVDGLSNAPSGRFSAIAVGRWHSCGLRADGTATCWGRNIFGETDPPAGQFSVSSGVGG